MQWSVDPPHGWTPERIAVMMERSLALQTTAAQMTARSRRQREDAAARVQRARARALSRVGPMRAARKACYDRNGPVVAIWRPDEPGRRTTRPAETCAVDRPAGLSLDRLVTRLFEVSLMITASRELAAAPVASRLDTAVEVLDDLVREVQIRAFADMRSDRPATAVDRPDSVVPAGHCHGDGPDGLVGCLESVASSLSACVARDGAAGHYGEAARAVGRALQVLRSGGSGSPTPRRADPSAGSR